ncbi:conserved hypothetical membrane protein [Formosa agariphila KMM 3901]|uniref:Conserved hypothetical membrane protein n=2 Tax=Formosa TaxID=225842 RepID=T2KP84_FORAG|nr:conserved hypothetical membrane protein [Formosa agariphila KMM 3901]
MVHLPIGFLVFAFLLEIFSRFKKDNTLTNAIPLALFAGAASALIACILGYMLSLSGDYEEDMVDSHFWFGIATTIITFLAWLIRIEKIKIPKTNQVKTNISTLTLLVILVSVTGHYGGNLTHGSDYLTKYLPFGKTEKAALIPVTNIEDAVVYDYLVNPILENKCLSCHNASKMKGGLSLQDSLAIMEGGKNGNILIAGNALKSEMIKRVLLNPSHDDFMPPEGKTPLTEEETAILTYWIDNTNAGFQTKVGDIKTPENIIKIASNFLNLGDGGNNTKTALPTVNKVDQSDIKLLIAEGFRLTELVFDSNIYEVVLPSKTVTESNPEAISEKLEKLLKIKDNVLWLYLEDNQVTDDQINTINQFKNLQKLKLDKNPISDTGISKIVSHKNIRSLNLYSTNITKNSLETFYNMPNLQNVYIWETEITKEDVLPYTKETDKTLNIVFGS